MTETWDGVLLARAVASPDGVRTSVTIWDVPDGWRDWVRDRITELVGEPTAETMTDPEASAELFHAGQRGGLVVSE